MSIATASETATSRDDATRRVVAHLRTLVIEDATTIRRSKSRVRALQRAGDISAPAQQRDLARARRNARIHLLLYGLVRGRAWVQMERNHPDGDPCLMIWMRVRASELQAALGADAAPLGPSNAVTA